MIRESSAEVAQTFGGRQAPGTGGRVLGARHRRPGDLGRWGLPQSGHDPADVREVLDADGEGIGGVDAELGVQVVEDRLEGPPFGLEDRGELGDEQRGGDPVLVLDEVGRDAVAERLLVAVVQALYAGDPLEAREGLLVGTPD